MRLILVLLCSFFLCMMAGRIFDVRDQKFTIIQMLCFMTQRNPIIDNYRSERHKFIMVELYIILFGLYYFILFNFSLVQQLLFIYSYNIVCYIIHIFIYVYNEIHNICVLILKLKDRFNGST
jgi:hypothetical protein